jgi:hypothetical protein
MRLYLKNFKINNFSLGNLSLNFIWNSKIQKMKKEFVSQKFAIGKHFIIMSM